jgi:hypothetical protein
MINDYYLSPEERAKLVEQGVILVEKPESENPIAEKNLNTKLIAALREEVKELRQRNRSLACTNSKLGKPRRPGTLRISFANAVEQIEGKMEELKRLRNDKTAVICDGASEAFKECIELIAEENKKLAGGKAE